MHRCLSCKGRMPNAAAQTYQGDFCSEFCFSTYPGNAKRLQSMSPAHYQPSTPRHDVDRILERNCDILKAFRDWRTASPTMADIGSLQWLSDKGFDFDFYTRVHQRGDGRTEVWCYEVGFSLERDGSVEPL